METNFLVECRLKINIESSFRETERSSTRFNLFTTNVKNRHIGESGRLISDIIEITKIRNINFLVTMNIEKAFGSLDHNFLIFTLEKYGFGQNFIL